MILLFLGGFLGLNAIARNQTRAMMYFSEGGIQTGRPEALSIVEKIKTVLVGVRIPRPYGTGTPIDLGLACRSEVIAEDNGVTLGAWFCPNKSNGPLVLLFHGYAGDKSDVLKDAKEFYDLGWSVLLVDFRGSGESSESYSTIGFYEAEDVLAAVHFAGNKLPHSKVVLFGHSMGAVAILRAVDRYHISPNAIIVEAVFDSMLNTVRNRFSSMGIPSFPGAQLLLFWGGQQFGFDGFTNNPVDYAKAVTSPILFLHGAKDQRARLEQGRRVFDAVPGAKQFVEFPDAEHESYVERFPEKWKQAVGEFLSDKL